MYISTHRESQFSTTDLIFVTTEACEEYLRHERCRDNKLHFQEFPDGKVKSCHRNIWGESIVCERHEGLSREKGAGFKRKPVKVAML